MPGNRKRRGAAAQGRPGDGVDSPPRRCGAPPSSGQRRSCSPDGAGTFAPFENIVGSSFTRTRLKDWMRRHATRERAKGRRGGPKSSALPAVKFERRFCRAAPPTISG